MPLVSRLLPCFVSAYGLQAVLAAIFVPLQDDRFYDLGGATGFLSTTLLSLYYPALRARTPLPALSSFAPRQLLISAAIGIWGARMGSFLVTRALKEGGDSRFAEIKKQPLTFIGLWMAQATWIFTVGLPAYLVNSVPSAQTPRLNRLDYAAVSLFVISLSLEALADRQKTQWRKERDEKKHHEEFISRGLWSLSRHPNYVGEVGVWTGIWALSLGTLRMAGFPRYAPLLALMSPVLTYLNLKYGSGVPPLERKADEKFGSGWKEYKSKVPVFFPWMKST